MTWQQIAPQPPPPPVPSVISAASFNWTGTHTLTTSGWHQVTVPYQRQNTFGPTPPTANANGQVTLPQGLWLVSYRVRFLLAGTTNSRIGARLAAPWTTPLGDQFSDLRATASPQQNLDITSTLITSGGNINLWCWNNAVTTQQISQASIIAARLA